MRLVLGLAALIAEANQLGRLGTAGTHRQQRAHAQGFHVLLFKHFNLKLFVRLGQRAGFLGQVARGADVTRLVAQGAGQVGAVADRLTVADGLGQLVGFGLVGAPQQALFQLGFAGFLALELVELVQAFTQGFHQQASAAVQITILDRD